MNITQKKLRCTVYFSGRNPVSGVAQVFEHCVCPEHAPPPGHPTGGGHLFWYGTVDLTLDDEIKCENLAALTDSSKREMVFIAFEDGRTGGVAFSGGASQSARMESGQLVHANFYWLCFAGMTALPLPPQPALENLRFIP